jgi:pimeloyl-ACP methyl ester carboxylesterase
MLPLPWVRPSCAALLALAGCASPADRFDAGAAAAGLRRIEVEGAGFHHAVYANHAPATGSVRIYFDGDGTPYLGKAIATDPTPQQSLVLALLAQDKGPALYLGRPCYHGETGTPRCTPDIWTRARYGEEVVASMSAAVRRLIAEEGARTVILVGHSGGGTLAMLIAPRIPQTKAVVSIAADLDVATWALYAREDLSGSLDPSAAMPLPAGIRQYHYTGGNDQVVPPAVTASGLHSASETLTVIDGFDHVCCWTAIWPSFLAQLDADGDAGYAPSPEPTAPWRLIRTPSTPP